MEQRISIERMEQAVNLFGSFDENVRLIESEFKVTISNREGELRVNGEVEDTMLATKALNALLTLSNRGEPITEQNVRYVISLVRAGQEDRISELTQDVICISSKGRPIKPKTIGQKKYIESVLKNTITIGVGPAGTGKTYLAVAAAVAAFRERKVNRIILTRPAVEAGERLGFLPGDLQSKVDPYLRPLYDALYQIMGAESFQRNMEKGLIEVAPLAYMRGRTLDNAYIILDEAQNTTPAVRRALRHARRGDVPEIFRARQYRGRAARLYARPHAGRQLYHFGRGAEHVLRADENVFDAHGL